MTIEARRSNEEAAIQLRAVRGDRVDLCGPVTPAAQALARATRRVATHDDDLPMTRRPLALSADESCPDIQDEVVTAPFGEGPVHVYPYPNGLASDGELRDCTLLVGREHDLQS